MALPSRVLNSGVTSLSTVAICGEGTDSISAAGSTASDATLISSIFNRVSTVAVGAGVKLPQTEMGATAVIANAGANNLTVYPFDTGSTIGGNASNVLLPLDACMYWAVSNTRWEPLQGSGTILPGGNGSFYSTATQTAAAINTAYAITLSNTSLSNGVSIGSPSSRIVVAQAGVYSIQFSAQFDKTAATAAAAYLWLRINGVNVANSAGKISVQGADAEVIPAWGFVQQLSAGDYIELMWSTNDINVFIAAFAAAPPVPAIPSVIVTVVQIA